MPMPSSTATSSTRGPSAFAVNPAVSTALTCLLEEDPDEDRGWCLSIVAENDSLEQLCEHTDWTKACGKQSFYEAFSTPAYEKEALNTPWFEKEALSTPLRTQAFSQPACGVDAIGQHILLDSGASRHVAPPTWMEHLPFEPIPLSQRVNLRTADGSPLPSIGMRTVRYTLPGVPGTAVSQSDSADSQHWHSRERRPSSAFRRTARLGLYVQRRQRSPLIAAR